ncbi:hypothetical protein SynPROSU1_02099 [Synechococcus sp. PROS-U-1]|nr:hypothetical protein SynPROSU1_02099 [Synechococcus sp. PROS-U-1]
MQDESKSTRAWPIHGEGSSVYNAWICDSDQDNKEQRQPLLKTARSRCLHSSSF